MTFLQAVYLCCVLILLVVLLVTWLIVVAAGYVHDADILLERAPVATAPEYDASSAHLHSDDVGIGGYQLSAEVVGEVLREERPQLFAQREEVLLRPQRLNVPPHIHNNKKFFECLV